MAVEEQEKYSNFFDDMHGVIADPASLKKQADDIRVKGQRLDYLIHQVFSQHEQGRELLAIWKETLIMRPTVGTGMDQFQAGINEGMKSFIRGVLITIQRVERGEV